MKKINETSTCNLFNIYMYCLVSAFIMHRAYKHTCTVLLPRTRMHSEVHAYTCTHTNIQYTDRIMVTTSCIHAYRWAHAHRYLFIWWGDSQSRCGIPFKVMWMWYMPVLKKSPTHLATCEWAKQTTPREHAFSSGEHQQLQCIILTGYKQD